ncbi:AbrB/MazE/SpoVT family DNA-binding domain-containing protein [Methylocystis echinoides]|jgi:putative addiction module antidote|uniref:Transcriptional regulator n=1 Tax=Methylocystis echinoides TaxID=29468 RepID=A0A9W6LSA6_9HYPH|nr:AbrB/MazE/SpoVT family DNA-binding domain-containing protein [Methylocystis echinoides]GLI93470.1 transcriptional regulator [Methylocystis echinoides]
MSDEQIEAYGALKVIRIGNSLGVVLPREIVAELAVEKGDRLYLTLSPEGYRLTRSDPEFERRVALARRIISKRHNALRELSK